MASGDLNFKQIIDNRYSGTRRIVKVKFYTILTSILILLGITLVLYYIAYNDIESIIGINLKNNFFYQFKYYIYWIIFFNNIFIPITCVYLYYLFMDNIDILRFTGEKKNPFNSDDSFNL